MMASWNSKQRSTTGDMAICLIIGVVAMLFFLSVAFRDAGASATVSPSATPTLAISVTWGPTPAPPTPAPPPDNYPRRVYLPFIAN